MKDKPNDYLESCRVKDGYMGSTSVIGNNGLFQFHRAGRTWDVMASDGGGWDHISVSSVKRDPPWGVMCWIKDLFFKEDETVLQYHPKTSGYVNIHEHCLHMWKNQKEDFELPPQIYV